MHIDPSKGHSGRLRTSPSPRSRTCRTSRTRTTRTSTASGWFPTAHSAAGPVFVFAIAAVVAVAAPLVAWVTQHLVEPGCRHPLVLRRCGVRRSSALVVATGAGAVAAVALVRDHAVLLLAPVAVAALGVAALVTTNGVLN